MLSGLLMSLYWKLSFYAFSNTNVSPLIKLQTKQFKVIFNLSSNHRFIFSNEPALPHPFNTLHIYISFQLPRNINLFK